MNFTQSVLTVHKAVVCVYLGFVHACVVSNSEELVVQV